MNWEIVIAVAALFGTVAGGMGSMLFSGVVKGLDRVVDRLDRIAENTAAHGARLDALERAR